MSEDWLNRWAQGRTGWHEVDGNAGLKAHWPLTGERSRVLAPFCGKSPDLKWLVDRGHEVVGVELAETPILQFFEENNIDFQIESGQLLDRYSAKELPLTLYRGDYLKFADEPFDALYDRGALVALPENLRPGYIEHTKQLLKPNATIMLITMEYDQSIVAGPPFAVPASELSAAWGDLRRVAEVDDIDNCPPKFRAAGVTDVLEVVWLSR